MGSATGIMQHIAEKHLHDSERIYVVRRYVKEMMDEELGTTQMEAAAGLHHALHLSAMDRELDAHDPEDAGTLIRMLQARG